MGYHIEQRAGKFRIDAEQTGAALAAIKGLAGQETVTDASGPHYRWVDTAEFLAAETFAEALLAWRWEVEVFDGEAIEAIQFYGEKLGDDDLLFAALAPYVKAGSYLEMQGEDGEAWRWEFDGKACREVNGELVFATGDEITVALPQEGLAALLAYARAGVETAAPDEAKLQAVDPLLDRLTDVLNEKEAVTHG